MYTFSFGGKYIIVWKGETFLYTYIYNIYYAPNLKNIENINVNAHYLNLIIKENPQAIFAHLLYCIRKLTAKKSAKSLQAHYLYVREEE